MFIYDIFGNLIGEYTTGGSMLRDYIYLGSKPIALISLPEGIHIGPIGCPSICNINVGAYGNTPNSVGAIHELPLHKSGVLNGLLYISPLFALALIRIYHRGKRGRIDLPGLILIAGVVSLSIVMFTKAQGSNENIYYYHTDHLGTPIILTDANQQTVWDATYEPFGKANITVSLVTNNLRFPGQYYDSETGLHYNWHRYYWPDVGRYVRSDPLHRPMLLIQFKEIPPPTPESSVHDIQPKTLIFFVKNLREFPQELHPYTYVKNNPLIRGDFLGLGWWCTDLNLSGIQWRGCCKCPDKITITANINLWTIGNRVVHIDGECKTMPGGCAGRGWEPATGCYFYLVYPMPI